MAPAWGASSVASQPSTKTHMYNNTIAAATGGPILGNTGGASGSWGPVAPPKVPVNTNTPTNNLLSDLSNQQTTQQNQANDAFTKESGLINDSYNQLLGVYGQQESNANAQAAAAKSDLQSATDNQKTDLANSLALSQKTLDTNKNNAELAKQSGLSDLTGSYNDLQRSYQNRYGGGSSTAGQISEIIGQQYLKNQSNIQAAYQSSLDAISNASVQVANRYASDLNKANSDFNTQLHDLDAQLQNALTQIAGSKAMAETDKQNRSLQLLDDARHAAQARADQLAGVKQQIQLWKVQEDAAIQSGIQYNNQLVANASNNVTNNNTGISSYGSSLSTNYAPSAQTQNTPISYNNLLNPNQKQQDPYLQLNPWLA